MSFGNLPINYLFIKLNLGGVKKSLSNNKFTNTNNKSKLAPLDFFTNPDYLMERLIIRYFSSKNNNFKPTQNFVKCKLTVRTWT